AFKEPETAKQLRNRRELAVHAVVGLDRGRRQRVESTLLAILTASRGGEWRRVDAALIGSALGDLNPAFAREAARALMEDMSGATDAYTLACQGQALAALAVRLDPGEATSHAEEAARRIVDGMAKTDDSYTLSSLSYALSKLADRLQPAKSAA